MTEDDTLDNLSWFHQLTTDEKVSILGQPHLKLPVSLVKRLARPDVGCSFWTANSMTPVYLVLRPKPASALNAHRLQLDWWWSRLAEADRTYVIENRDGTLHAKYADTVRLASEMPLDQVPAIRVAVVHDADNDDRFSLTPMVHLYVELKAREAAA